MAVIGYARVSTVGQSLDEQLDALQAVPCDRIFREKASGAKADRPELAAALAATQPGDTIVVTRLDRLGRSFQHLVSVVEKLRAEDKGFRSLHDGIDTTTPAGRLVFRIFASLAEFERELIAERTAQTLASKRARGIRMGRPALVTPAVLAEAQRMLSEPGRNVSEVAALLRVGRSTLYRALEEAG